MKNPEFNPSPEEMGIKPEEEIVTETGLTKEELEKGVKTEGEEKIYYVSGKDVEVLKNNLTHENIVEAIMNNNKIPDGAKFDFDVDDERIRYLFDKRLGLQELKREKRNFGKV